MMAHLKPIIFPTLAVLWLAVCAFGLSKLAVYENTPAIAIRGPSLWQKTSLRRGTGYTLIMAIHPQCPCSRASLQELAVLITRCPTLQTDLLFVKPNLINDAWAKSDLWLTASKFPRCTLIIDEDGKLSLKLCAGNSGQVYLYDPDGRLAYCGGITVSRGHAGDNDGLASIIAIVNQEAKVGKYSGVFGCPLFANNPLSEKRGSR